MANRYQVIVVGGGPVGMALCLDLGLRGISCALVESRIEPHRIPKGQNLTQRSMEHFHFWGIANDVRAARLLPTDYPMNGIIAYGDLTSEYWYAPPLREVVNPYYFQNNERLPQYQVEAVLKGRLTGLATVECYLGWSAKFVIQDDDTARVTIVKQSGTGNEVLEADYIIGCDGAHSTVREQIGIECEGDDFDQLMVLAVFRSRELHERLKRFPERSTYRIMHRDLKGYWQFFGRIDVGEGWFFHAPVPADTTKDNYDFHKLLQKVAGFEFACEFDHVGFWDLRVAVAEEYRSGRVFIAGDAAHSHPPYGGYGLNNGLEDAANLGWKLAATFEGWGGDDLLRTYGEERYPVFKETGDDFITARIRTDREFFDRYNPEDNPMEFARAWKQHEAEVVPRMLTYEPHYEGSPIIFGPPGGTSGAHGMHTFAALPGHHLPPLLLSSGDNVFEGLGRGFTLLAFDFDDNTTLAFEHAAAALGVPMKIIVATVEGGRDAYKSRLILVRPDQYIAWTGEHRPNDVIGLIRKAIGRS